jgi:membrane protease YdiL (CAAX protease family)
MRWRRRVVTSAEQQLRRQAVLLGVVFEGGMALLACVAAWLLGRSPLGDNFAWTAQDAGWGVVATLPMLAAFLVLNYVPWAPLVRIRRFFEEVLRPLFQHCSLLELGLISLLAGLGEEMLFRAVIQGGLADWLGPWWGLLLASLLFGLLHSITTAYVVLAGVLGLYLGYVYLWPANRNLLVVIIAHALYDFCVLVYLLRGPAARENAGETHATASRT